MGRRKKVVEEEVEVVEEVSTTEESLHEEVEATEEVIPVSAAEGNSDMEQKMELMEKQIQTLTQALLLSRQPVKDEEDDATIGITRTGGGRITMQLSDAYGRNKDFKWEKLGSVQFLTPSQYEEFQDSGAATKFIARGYLTLDSNLENFVTPQQLIASLDSEALSDHIEGITDPTRLMAILQYIEGKRIQTSDPETGKPYVDSEGLPRAEVLPMDAKHRLAATMCADKIHALTGIRYSLTDG